MMGFTESGSAAEKILEARFDSLLNRDDLRQWLKHLSAYPHSLGSVRGKDNAEYIASVFRSAGLETEIEEFSALFPTPKTRVLEMTSPEPFTASLVEPAFPEDSTSGQSDQLPTYNAYSIDGDVRGDLVYVNYGVPKDYDELDRRGIDVRGRIVIARYGGSWRGIKPKVAAEHGAVGCIIYSDPHDDGYAEGDVYPKGAYRSDHGVQRGSVADMPLYAGDPSTPFVGATKGVKHLPVSESKTITKIPVLPISYADALPLLRALTGPVANDDWRGSLPLTYHIGPGATKVHLKVESNWNIVPVYDVIGKLKGGERSDEWIIRGNHHDAWVNGAEDPLSGLVALMSEAKAAGALAKSGWKPKRTIIYCAWDGEEPGLIGSTEWVETHAEELRRHGVLYLNTDGNGRGFFGAGGSHTLEKFINEVARDVVDPQTRTSVADRERANRIVSSKGEERREARDRRDLRISALGSGSDYSPFLQHLGIAACSIGYGGENGGGSYHSIYDSYDHFVRFNDPGFDYGIALAETGGRVILRTANAEVVPFEFTNFTETVGKYVAEVKKLADDMRDETDEQNRLLRENSLALAADPRLTNILPKPKDPVPYLNFAPLQNALAMLQDRSKAFDSTAGRTPVASLPASRQAQLDNILMTAERELVTKQGLPHRPWYVHQIYAPGAYTGYGVKTLPGVREAIELRKWDEANEQITVTAGVIESFSRKIDQATKLLQDSQGDHSTR
jgi:N-acetylated-alpha-linked acidic dipeptidase